MEATIEQRISLINQIIEKFSHVTELGKTKDDDPTYSHSKSLSGIGCAIGCLLSPEAAESVERTSIANEQYSIGFLIKDEKYPELNFLAVYGEEFLEDIQSMHDISKSVVHFLNVLNACKEEMLEEQNGTKNMASAIAEGL